jgi:hypothetical protein
MVTFGQAGIGIRVLPNVGIISQYVKLFQYYDFSEKDVKY